MRSTPPYLRRRRPSALLSPYRATAIEKVAIYSATLNYDGWNVPFYYPWAPYGIPLLAKLPFVKD